MVAIARKLSAAQGERAADAGHLWRDMWTSPGHLWRDKWTALHSLSLLLSLLLFLPLSLSPLSLPLSLPVSLSGRL